MNEISGEHFLTEDEVVARYRNALTAGTLRNWRSKGQGPAFTRIGKAVLYARADLEDWEAQRRSRPSQQACELSESEPSPSGS